MDGPPELLRCPWVFTCRSLEQECAKCRGEEARGKRRSPTVFLGGFGAAAAKMHCEQSSWVFATAQ